ncbi:MAG TPA: DNA cytosine methyltransferase [Actinomycetota bacterium]|nr:DNA cytosine methyltransferase [Actinomycetota bacterium]
MTRSVASPPVALSLFSGAGGMDLGVRQAGFRVLASVELDPHCCASLRANAEPETKVLEADIRTVAADALRDELGLRPGELDLLFGGPPCQPFSQIGKRGGAVDPRASLLFEILRFAEALRPKAVLVEQVKGLLGAGALFGRLLDGLRDLGYEPTWDVLNAADYGVPQRRQRLIVVALGKGRRFALPAPSHGAARPQVTVGEALAGLGRRPPRLSGQVPDGSHVDVTPEGQQRRISHVPEGQWLAAQLGAPPEIRQTLKRKDTTKFRRLSRSAPSLTLRCGEIFFHPLEDRYLTPREYLRLHGYPDWYRLRGPVRSRSGQARQLDQHRQVANSVPPPLALAVAERIREALRSAV